MKVYIYVCMNVCIDMYICMSGYTRVCVCVRACVCGCAPVCMHVAGVYGYMYECVMYVC